MGVAVFILGIKTATSLVAGRGVAVFILVAVFCGWQVR